MTYTVHPDPEIAAGILEEMNETERADMAAGFPPRAWRCDCDKVHRRGHFGKIGIHRCLRCGYVGAGGELIAPEDTIKSLNGKGAE